MESNIPDKGDQWQSMNRLEMDEKLSVVKRMLFVALFALLSFAIIEAGVRIAEGVLRPPGPLLAKESALFPDKKMSEALFDEYDACEGKEVLPFSGWRAKEFHGKYINIDSKGLRRTWNPVQQSGRQIKIFIAGGSTVFGFGARDEFTIPSFISKILNDGSRNGLTYVVTNFGEGNYSMFQGAVRLTSQLMSGERPDIVIFYGGANEVSFVYDYGLPGIEASKKAVTNIVGERVFASPKYRLRMQLRRVMNEYCESCRVGIAAARTILPRFAHGDLYEEHGWDDHKVTDYSLRTAQDYQERFPEYVNRLGASFHFHSVVFWQPTLFSESKRVGEELPPYTLDTSLDHPVISALFRQTFQAIHTDPEKNLYKLTDALEARTKSCYLDTVHLSEECNGMVAKKIVEILKQHYLPDVEKAIR